MQQEEPRHLDVEGEETGTGWRQAAQLSSGRLMNFLFRLDLFLRGPDVASTIEASVRRPLKARLLTLGRNASALEPAVFMQKKLGQDVGLSAGAGARCRGGRSVCCVRLSASDSRLKRFCLYAVLTTQGVVMCKSLQGSCIAGISGLSSDLLLVCLENENSSLNNSKVWNNWSESGLANQGSFRAKRWPGIG